jgi:hypothetical protein
MLFKVVGSLWFNEGYAKFVKVVRSLQLKVVRSLQLRT